MTIPAPPTPPPAAVGPEVRTAGRPRWPFVALLLLCVGAVGWLLFGGLADNIVYLEPVSEAVVERSAKGTDRFRIGGAVVPGSIDETTDGVRFEVTEGGETVTVVHRGDPPDLFEDGAPVVCEGRWQGAEFASDRLLIRHGSEYRPPDVDTGTGAGTRP